jgi:hypothetical protein
MNMPTHIMAKPIEVETVTRGGKFESSAVDITQANQRRVLRPDTDQ